MEFCVWIGKEEGGFSSLEVEGLVFSKIVFSYAGFYVNLWVDVFWGVCRSFLGIGLIF